VVNRRERTPIDASRAFKRRGASKMGCLFTLLIVAAVLYFGVNAFEKYYLYLQYKDAMAQEIRFRSFLPDTKIRENLRLIADSLGLPEDAGIVTVTRDRGVMTIESHYEELIELPGYKKEVHFEPKASGTY
jgi:hypothetical protein